MTLHIYPQQHAHGECRIVGTREAMAMLFYQLAELSTCDEVNVECVDSDGQPYAVRIECVSDEAAKGMRVPYGEEGK